MSNLNLGGDDPPVSRINKGGQSSSGRPVKLNFLTGLQIWGNFISKQNSFVDWPLCHSGGEACEIKGGDYWKMLILCSVVS